MKGRLSRGKADTKRNSKEERDEERRVEERRAERRRVVETGGQLQEDLLTCRGKSKRPWSRPFINN